MIINPDGSFEMAVVERLPAEKAALAAKLGRVRPPPGFGALTRDVLTARWEDPNESPEVAYARAAGTHPDAGSEAIELAERGAEARDGRAGPSRPAAGAGPGSADLAYVATMASMAPGRFVIWRPNVPLSERAGALDARASVGGLPGSPLDEGAHPVGRASALSRTSGPQTMVPLLEIDMPAVYGGGTLDASSSQRTEPGWFGRFRSRSTK